MPDQFGSFVASELYCPKCKRSQPLHEKFLLVLPDGELHEYVCRVCGTSLGERTIINPTVTAAAAIPPSPTINPNHLLG